MIRVNSSTMPGVLLQPVDRLFARESPFSAADLAHLLGGMEDRAGWVSGLLVHAHRQATDKRRASGLESLVVARMIHALGSAVAQLADDDGAPLGQVLPDLAGRLPHDVAAWLRMLNVVSGDGVCVGDWSSRVCAAAFKCLAAAVIDSGPRFLPPTNALRSDEIVWGCAPVRADLCGGWTDTPPYSLEFGGSVVNVAVNLNEQPPVQAFARVIGEPLIRITSIDRGTRTEISRIEDLTDFRRAPSEFALVKAALVLSCLGPGAISGAGPCPLRQMFDSFGGGLEVTTLAAVPQGSGLGTSSILSAVVVAVLDHVMGRRTDARELFHRVLRLEQSMATGGGWQDQIGGVIGGMKLVAAPSGMVPNVEIRSLPDDVLAAAPGGEQVLLYYTGLTRVAKNILERVVAGYLDRDRRTMDSLAELRALSVEAAEALVRGDLPAVGGIIGAAWELNKQLDPHCTSEVIESLLARLRPYVYGAKLLGAGGGGFLLMCCKSPAAAAAVRAELEARPANARARFFRFSVNREGLRVTAC